MSLTGAEVFKVKLQERAARRAQRDAKRDLVEEAPRDVAGQADEGDDEADVLGGELPELPETSSESEEDRPLARKDVVPKEMRSFAKVLSQSMAKSMTDKKSSRSSLPKLEYASQVKVNAKTFPQWVDQIHVVSYSRNWPKELSVIGGDDWDGVDDGSEMCIARKECYGWMECSIPTTLKYLIAFVRKGDAKGVFTALWNRFYKTTPLTIGTEVGIFWSLSQKTLPVDQFAASVNDHAVRLLAAGQDITDQNKATVFISGLSDKFVPLKEQYRHKTKFNFLEGVNDAIEFASVHGFLTKEASTAGTLLSVETVCKFHRMKKGCYAGDKCPLAKTHTPETKGKGWKDGAVKAVAPKSSKGQKGAINAVKARDPVRQRTTKCYCCGGVDHILKDCKLKEQFASFQASKSGTVSATTYADHVNVNFVLLPHVMAVKQMSDKWLLDGGSSEHITSQERLLVDKEQLIEPLIMMVGNGESLVATHKGCLMLNDVKISGVLLCKECPLNILSEGKFLELGCTVSKTKEMAVVRRSNSDMLKAIPEGRLMFVSHAYRTSGKCCASLRQCI